MKKFTTRLPRFIVFSLVALMAALSVTGCSTTTHSPAHSHVEGRLTAGQPNAMRDSHEQLTSALWFQTAAEYRVDSAAKYRAAQQILVTTLTNTSWTAALEQTDDASKLPAAVIMDLDETVLDNSRFQGQLVLDRTNYTDALWAEWVAKFDAAAIPGALDFISRAQALGVKVIFVTNRTRDEETHTRMNLAKLGITLPKDEDTVLTKAEKPDWGSDKTSRRSYLAQRYRIVMLVGDDLGDFIGGARATPEKRIEMAEKHQSYWGERWVLLNNPSYGSWDSALYGHDFKKHDTTVLQEKLGRVKGFK
jgi:5'-nucleotidase (lipoprotein e(P4) family)